MFWGGHTHTFTFFLSCILIVLLLCTLPHHLSLCPVLSPCSPFLSLVACPFCCFGALLVSSPLCLPFAPCPLCTHARTVCLLGARTQAPLPTHALCHLLFLVPSLFPCSPLSRTPLFLLLVLRLSCHIFIVTTACVTYHYRCLYVLMSHAIYLFTLWVLESLYPAQRLYALMTHAIYLLG